jgi:hypothetical protein
MDRYWTQRQGQAAVYQVASQLLMRGVNVSFPAIDDGVDLIVESGVRIQVKSTRLYNGHKNYPHGAYCFHFTRWTRSAHVKYLRGEKVDRRLRFSDRSDVVVLWGVDQNRFWIVPALELDDTHMVAVGCETVYRKPVDPSVVKAMRENVSRHKDVADDLGVSRATVSRKIHDLNLKTSKASIVSSYEGRWDIIISQIAAYKQEPEEVQQEVL